MNITLDWLNTYAERLTIRLLRLVGASEDTINKVKAAFLKRDKAVSQADKELRRKNGWIKWLIYSIIAVALVFIGLKIKQLLKK